MAYNQDEIFRAENPELLESLEYLIKNESPERVKEILRLLQDWASKETIHFRIPSYTLYPYHSFTSDMIGNTDGSCRSIFWSVHPYVKAKKMTPGNYDRCEIKY